MTLTGGTEFALSLSPLYKYIEILSLLHFFFISLLERRSVEGKITLYQAISHYFLFLTPVSFANLVSLLRGIENEKNVVGHYLLLKVNKNHLSLF